MGQTFSDEYDQAIDLGIHNMVAALVEAKVEDETVVSLLNKYWGIGRDEAIDRIAYEKRDSPSRELRSYLKLQGWPPVQIVRFIHDTNAAFRLEHEPGLRELKPKDLKTALEKKPTKRI